MATFGPSGEWDTLDQSGNVRFQQADHRASAERAKFVRATDQIALDGSPVISDATSRTAAGSVTIDQKSGELKPPATSSRRTCPPGSRCNESRRRPRSHFRRHAFRLDDFRPCDLPGPRATVARRIGIGREADRSVARRQKAPGHWTSSRGVSAKLGKSAGRAVRTVGGEIGSESTASPPAAAAPATSQTAASETSPTLWVIHAPLLTYWDDQAKARLEGGVTATSEQGGSTSRTLDAFLGPAPAPTKPASSAAPAAASASAAAGGRQLTRIVAQGSVVVRQGDRRGTAEQAEYTAADEKFVLSGGQPTITDASSDTTTGRSLTFFVASDTILIDSQEGSRTLTKHRVEK